jgi:hypothetical protein
MEILHRWPARLLRLTFILRLPSEDIRAFLNHSQFETEFFDCLDGSAQSVPAMRC